ncbi:testis-expressed protein 26 isoform X1 [Phascolarctos cinereus]|uniref:Testis-expressed protein 26 isoform X1 n=2 Tax=Phascolarctos cinereus TaxID=38626 RepID=A0A6P5L3K2_PHACI|nr:testis-expressed protein 26 isoform X1 [Phascolarctos cinereus]
MRSLSLLNMKKRVKDFEMNPRILHPRLIEAGDTNWNSYETTMMHVYTPKRIEVPDPIRHSDFKRLGYSYKLNDPIGNQTVYNEQYDWKPYSREEMINTATSLGGVINRPHPSKEFMIWKLPRQFSNTQSDCSSPWRIPATIKEIHKAIADQYTSSFREDYLDKSKLIKLKQTMQVPLDWKKLLPRRLETEFRRNFQVPVKIPELRDLTFRYGCNASLPIAAYGPVPSVLLSHIWNQEHSKKQSTYERHYGKEYLDFVMILNSLSETEIKKYLDKVPEHERKILQNFINENYNSGNKHK